MAKEQMLKTSNDVNAMELAEEEEEEPYDIKPLLKLFFKRYWKVMFFIFWPLALLFIICGSWNNGTTHFNEPNTRKGTIGYENRYIFRTIYIFLLMSGYWLTECIPMHFTGMIPIFAFPLMNVLSTGKVTACYLAGVNMTFITSMFLAIAVEYSNLHIRIAYLIIKFIGTDPRRLHFGVLTATFLLSMWLLNTAVAAMMCPIVKALLDTLDNVDVEDSEGSDKKEKKPKEEESGPSDAAVAYYLGVGYASSIGGLGTLIGTGATLLYKSLIEGAYSKADQEIVGFVPWTLFCLPVMFIVNVMNWFILQFLFMGLFRPRSKQYEYIRRARLNKRVVYKSVKDMLKQLGRMSWHESWVAGLFTLAILMMVTRKPEIFTGWQDVLLLFGPYEDRPDKKFISEPVILVLIVFIMLLVPANTDFMYSFSRDPKKRPKGNAPGLVTWKVLHEKTPWGLLFLLGGGKALAEAGAITGMTKYVGEALTVFRHVDKTLILALTTGAMTIVTQFASNMTAINMIIPVILQLASGIGCHPAFLGHPAGIMASAAFMLPVGTTANVVVGGYGNLTTTHFLKGGSLLVLATYAFVLATYLSYGRLLWPDLGEFPSWAQH